MSFVRLDEIWFGFAWDSIDRFARLEQSISQAER